VLLSPQTGMVGYPAFSGPAVLVKSILNPKIQNGTKLTIQSSLTPAAGNWSVFHAIHDFESNVPHGKWFTLAHANALDPWDTP
jgi:hypothetical protein